MTDLEACHAEIRSLREQLAEARRVAAGLSAQCRDLNVAVDAYRAAFLEMYRQATSARGAA